MYTFKPSSHSQYVEPSSVLTGIHSSGIACVMLFFLLILPLLPLDVWPVPLCNQHHCQIFVSCKGTVFTSYAKNLDWRTSFLSCAWSLFGQKKIQAEFCMNYQDDISTCQYFGDNKGGGWSCHHIQMQPLSIQCFLEKIQVSTETKPELDQTIVIHKLAITL